jgi:phosphoribosylanthranilate isomerase
VPSLTGSSFVKICGITSVVDAQTVIDLGGDAIGLILAESSRQLSRDAARAIAEETKGLVQRVAVFRHNSDSFILDSVDAIGVDVAQVHGELNDVLVDELRTRGVGVIKALSVHEDEFTTFDESVVDAVLLDGASPGSGEVHAWPDLAVRGFRRPAIAAGGLDSRNVAQVIDTTGVWGVDVSSGVERSPGVKDPALVRDFIERARARFQEREERRG